MMNLWQNKYQQAGNVAGFSSIWIFTVVMMVSNFSCQYNRETAPAKADNPAAVGFNQTASDAKAIALADEVMQAMGGRKAWDETRFIKWNFFGRRSLQWDKLTGDVRIDSPSDSMVFLINVFDKTGRVQNNGHEITDTDSLAQMVKAGHEIWINDSYWLVMPFKLKDSGVTLKYKGQHTTEAGDPAEVLELTFDGVGVTPQNKYQVYVDKATKLVSQWAFFQKATDSEPRFVTPWAEYKKYGHILLASNRGKYELNEIGVFEFLPDSVFSEF